MLRNDDILLAIIAQRPAKDVTDYVYRMTYDITKWGSYQIADTGQKIISYTNGSYDGSATPPDGTNHKRFRCGLYVPTRSTRTNLYLYRDEEEEYVPWTACTWMAKSGAGKIQNVFSFGNFGYNLSRGGCAFRLTEDDRITAYYGRNVVYTSEPINVTAWHHYAFTWAVNGFLQVFIDGRKVAETGNKPSSISYQRHLNLNSFEGSASTPEVIGEGYYADHRVYWRVLSEEEIDTVYRQLSWKKTE